MPVAEEDLDSGGHADGSDETGGAGGLDRLRVPGIRVAGDAERRIGPEHASDLPLRALAAVGHHDEPRMDALAHPDAAAAPERDPARALRSSEHGGEHRPVRDRVTPVCHALGLAGRRGDRRGIHVVAAERQGADDALAHELV